MRGNRTATAALRPQTGFEDRPGHQAHAFRDTHKILVHLLAIAAGEYAGVAYPPRDTHFVGVLKPGLSVLAARVHAIAESGERDLTVLSTRKLYLLQNRLRRLRGGEEARVEPNSLPSLEQESRGGCRLRRG